MIDKEAFKKEVYLRAKKEKRKRINKLRRICSVSVASFLVIASFPLILNRYQRLASTDTKASDNIPLYSEKDNLCEAENTESVTLQRPTTDTLPSESSPSLKISIFNFPMDNNNKPSSDSSENSSTVIYSFDNLLKYISSFDKASYDNITSLYNEAYFEENALFAVSSILFNSTISSAYIDNNTLYLEKASESSETYYEYHIFVNIPSDSDTKFNLEFTKGNE